MEEEDDDATAAEAAAVPGPPLLLVVRRVLAMYWATNLLCVCGWEGGGGGRRRLGSRDRSPLPTDHACVRAYLKPRLDSALARTYPVKPVAPYTRSASSRVLAGGGSMVATAGPCLDF